MGTFTAIPEGRNVGFRAARSSVRGTPPSPSSSRKRDARQGPEAALRGREGGAKACQNRRWSWREKEAPPAEFDKQWAPSRRVRKAALSAFERSERGFERSNLAHRPRDEGAHCLTICRGSRARRQRWGQMVKPWHRLAHRGRRFVPQQHLLRPLVPQQHLLRPLVPQQQLPRPR